MKRIFFQAQIGADEYVVKPFNIGILKANVANLLANRALLRSKYANLDLDDEEHDEDCINCSQDIDWKFIAKRQKECGRQHRQSGSDGRCIMQPDGNESYKFLQ